MRKWKVKALEATKNTRFGAILHAALGIEKDFPRFHGKASLTSDGYVLANFTDRSGQKHYGAFVGSFEDLNRNIQGLAEHLKLNSDEKRDLSETINGWIRVRS